jgi:DNA-binding HxlR family transcriptional regulator
MGPTMARKKGYGQFCPVAKAAEVVAERWTLLVVRELLCGSRRFNELRQGVPLMSPSLLSQRLRELEDAGVVERRSSASGSGSEYHLTAAGAELRPVVLLLGSWGSRWAQSEVRREDLDPGLLMWDIRRRADQSALPNDRRTVVQFDLSGVPMNKRRWWLVFERGEVDLCLKDPGHEVDLLVSSHITTLTDVWVGHMELPRALRAESIRLEGPTRLVRSFRSWFTLSVFADTDRPE